MVRNVFLIVVMIALAMYGHAIYSAPATLANGVAMCIVCVLFTVCVLIMIESNKEEED